MSEIQAYYKDKTVFITGATGFLGKLLLEKLLRSCPGLKKIYLLLRNKKGVEPRERLNQLFSVPVYDKLRTQHSSFIEKLEIFHGDLEQPYLGLSKENIDHLQRCVQIVFHCGATVRFDETLRKVGIVNVRATKHLMEICKDAVMLEAFVYVSTAYSYCYKRHVEERIYDPYLKVGAFLRIIESFDDDTLEKLTPIILRDLPNTYILSKSTSEKMLAEEGYDLPVAIVRPSIVISSFKEPIEGWTDNYYGASGIFLAGYLGLLRSIHGNTENKADLIPVDFVVNNIIVAAWDTHKRFLKQGGLKVFTCVTGKRNAITWGEFKTKVTEHGMKNLSNLCIWYPFGTMVKSRTIHLFNMFLLHTVPAVFVDLILVVLLRKPFMLKLTEKLKKFTASVSYFTNNEWLFEDKNTKELFDGLMLEDKTLFPFDVEALNWDAYFSGYMKGLRVYLTKDPMESLPAANRRYNVLFVTHYTVVTIALYLFYKFTIFVYSKF